MIQLGTLGNFFHAIWADDKQRNIILPGHCVAGNDFAIGAGEGLESALAVVIGLKPDAIIAGRHTCRINCSECCDQPAYKSRVARRYCEYLTEVGSYCIPRLAGEEIADDVCGKWFCSSLCEDPSDHFSGYPLDTPLINIPSKHYTLAQKQEFVKLAAMIADKVPVNRVMLESARGMEVMLYKEAKRELLKLAEGKTASLIEFDEFDKARALMGNNPYFEMLREWEGMYCRRKGIQL